MINQTETIMPPSRPIGLRVRFKVVALVLWRYLMHTGKAVAAAWSRSRFLCAGDSLCISSKVNVEIAEPTPAVYSDAPDVRRV